MLALAAALAAPALAEPRQDVLAPLMAGEFALQAGQLPDAARWYLDAAREAEADATLADRATRIAMLANDDKASAEALALWRARDPQSLAMHAASASLALRRGQARQARRELQQLLKSEDPRGWRYALVALSGGREQATTARVLGQLVDGGLIPDELPAWQEFGRLALRLEDQPLAKRIVDQVVARFPDEPRVAVLRAGQLQQSGRIDEARAMLVQTEPRAGDDPEVRAMLAIAYESLRDYGAIARVMAMGPQDTQTYGAQASALARGDDTEGLTALYDQLVGEGVEPDAARRLLLGRLAEFLKRPDEALAWYRGVATGAERTEARIRAAAVLHALDRRDEAYAEARALQNDGSADDDARRDAYLLEAELRQSADDEAGELDALARGLAAYPDDNALLYARALAWERRDRIDRAEADLRKVLVTDPENVAALNALGYTLADRTTRYQEALELIDRARTADPDNAAIVDSYGWVLYRLGRREEALVELRRAWGLMKDAEIAAHVGEVLWVMGRRDEARRFFDEARQLDPDNRSLLRALEALGVPETAR